MQNLPKIQKKKIPSFKSPFLESLTKNASVIQSENTDATLLKVNSYDISIGNINNNIIYCNSHNNNSNSRHINPKESRNLGLIKKGFRKIFNNEEKKIEPKENKSFFFDTKKRKDIFKKNSLSSFDGNQKIEIVQFPRITETDFKKVIEKNRKNLKVIINRNITPEPLLYDTIQSKFDFENKINDKKISKEI